MTPPADTAVATPPREGVRLPLGGEALTRGISITWISVIVMIPLAAVATRSLDEGPAAFWDAVSTPEAWAAIKLTVIASLIVVAINALYGSDSPVGIEAAYTKAAVVMALLFVTLPFVVRAVQPVLMELDEEMEEAAASLGAPNHRIFRSIILPNLTPAIIAGCALAFARAIGEFGSLVLLTGNIPFDTQVASVYIFGRIESDNVTAAAAVSVLLLVISVGILFALNLFGRWRSRHERG